MADDKNVKKAKPLSASSSTYVIIVSIFIATLVIVIKRFSLFPPEEVIKNDIQVRISKQNNPARKNYKIIFLTYLLLGKCF